MNSFNKQLEYWGELLRKLCHGDEEERDVIAVLEMAATGTSGCNRDKKDFSHQAIIPYPSVDPVGRRGIVGGGCDDMS